MKDKNRKQPKIANWILSRVSDPAEKNSIIGDFAEIYFEIAENNGILKAKLWFWQHILLSLPSFIRSLIYGSGAMFKNYFKIALRNITNNKTYSFLNLSGLSLGLVSVILIFLYVQYELSFDSYHENYDRIYRIVRDLPSGHAHAGKTITTYSVAPLGQALVDEYPDVESSIRIFDEDEILVSYNNNNFIEHNVIFTDTEIFRMFSFSLLQGDPATALDDPYSVVLSEKMAEKYFGNDDPMGKILNFNYNKVKDFRVTGILKNIPDNSHFEIDFLIPFKTFGILIDADLSGWRRNLSITYIKLSENADSEIIESNLHGLIETQIGNDPEAAGRKFTRHFLQPLSKIHLYSDVDAEIGSNNDIMVLYIFSSVAILIILIACINYMNLSTSRSIQRSKEVGMRKVVGATRKQLIIQFYFESGILTIFALVISLIAVYAVLPGFNSYIERELDPVHLMNSQTLIWISLITFVVIVISGSYPALFLSSFQPINALKSRLTGISQRISLRNILVVFQFTISILLIICNITINGQLDFINMMDVGYEKEHVLSIEIRGDELRKNLGAVKTELKRNPDVLDVCSSTYLPSRILDQTGMDWPGKIDKKFIETYTGEIDYDFIDLYGIEIIEGRNFSRDYPSDGANGAFLLNEAAVNLLGWENPVGREMIHWNGEQGKVVGIMKDFNFHSLHRKIEPLYLFLDPEERNNFISVKTRGENIRGLLAFIEKKMKDISPQYPFVYSFFDDVFESAYRSEQKIESIFRVFTFIAVFIACLGLFGLASYTAERRIKEIGIRKVLGANINKIVLLLTGNYIKWILAANVIAWPMGYYVMNKWLSNFAYRIEIGISVFFLSALIVLLIAVLTISIQTIKAAVSDPVRSLRYE